MCVPARQHSVAQRAQLRRAGTCNVFACFTLGPVPPNEFRAGAEMISFERTLT